MQESSKDSGSFMDGSSGGASTKSGLLQVAFLLKEENAGKLHSHRWVFNAFSMQLQPEYIYLLDVGTIPHKDSFVKMFECMETEPLCGGCCGEIIPYNPDWYNLVVVAQIFEYKVSNIMDKAMESVFGYIPVLPGAFSAYRFAAIEAESYGGVIRGPLVEYFAHFRIPAQSVSALKGNMFLAEDRILCFEIISRANKNWFLRYADGCYGETDVPYRLVDLMVQRRRWLNGAIFAMIYSMQHMGRFFKKSNHTMAVKCRILFQCLFYIVNVISFWLALTTAILVLFYIFQTTLDDSSTFAWLHTLIISVFIALVGIQIFATFVFPDPRTSKHLRRLYRVISAIHGLIALLFVTQTIILVFFGNDDLGLRIIGSVVFGSVAVVAVVAGNGTGWKLAVSVLPYLFMLPTFLIMFSIHAICNLNDLSWGTKGLSKRKYKALPMLARFQTTLGLGNGSDDGVNSNQTKEAAPSIDSNNTSGGDSVEEGWDGTTGNPIFDNDPKNSMKKRTSTLDLFPNLVDLQADRRNEEEKGVEMGPIPGNYRNAVGREISVASRHEGKGSGGIDCGFTTPLRSQRRTLSEFVAYDKRMRKQEKWETAEEKTEDDVEAKYRDFRNKALAMWLASNITLTCSILFSGDNAKNYLTTVFIFTAAVNTPRLVGALIFYFDMRLWVGRGRPDVLKDSLPLLSTGGLLFQFMSIVCSLVALFSYWWTVECTYPSVTLKAPVKTYWYLPQVCLDSELGGGNCYGYDNVGEFANSVLLFIGEAYEVEGLPDDYGTFQQSYETRFEPALALIAFGCCMHIFVFVLYALMFSGKLRMWESANFLMWLLAIICIFTFTSILLVTNSKLYDPTSAQLPFCLDPSDPTITQEATSLEYGNGLIAMIWVLLSSGLQVLVLVLINVYGTVKSANTLTNANQKIQKSLNGLATLAMPRASAQPSEFPVGKSDEKSSDYGPLLWLRKAAVFELLMFIVACVTTTASWFHLRCYSDVNVFLFFDQTVPLALLPVVPPVTFFDQTVTFYSLFEVCLFKPNPDGKCFDYDEIDMFSADKSDTFDPMAGLVFLGLLSHLALFISFTFLSVAQIFAKQMKDTVLDRALNLQSKWIPIGTLSLSLFAAFMHFLTMIVLTTSDVYHSRTADLDFCSSDFSAPPSNGIDLDFDDGLNPGIDLGIDGDGVAAVSISRDLTRDVGPALGLTIILLLCAIGEALFISFSSVFTHTKEAKKEKEEGGSFGGESYPTSGGHGKHLSGIAEIPFPLPSSLNGGAFPTSLKGSEAPPLV